MIANACRLLDEVTDVIAEVEAEIRGRARPDQRIDALMQIEGVGLITAMTVVAEVGDITRFANSRKLCSWAGLTPWVRNSDTTVRHGPVTKMGSPVLRWVLGEAAQVAKRKPPYSDTFAQIAARRGRNVATTAIARRLLARCFHVLKNLEAASSAPAGAGRIVG